MQNQIVSYTYRNPEIHTAIHTSRVYLDELMAYILGEKLILGIEGECELNGVLLDYLYSTLHILDKPNVNIIYTEIRRRAEEIASDYVYQNLLLNGEFYLKYDYHLGKKFTRLQLYVDPSEAAWLHW